MRKGGPRDKVAELFTAVLRETNSARGLGSAPIRLEDGMEKMDEGQDLLARIASADRDRTMAEGGEAGHRRGRAREQGPMLGILAAPNAQRPGLNRRSQQHDGHVRIVCRSQPGG